MNNTLIFKLSDSYLTKRNALKQWAKENTDQQSFFSKLNELELLKALIPDQTYDPHTLLQTMLCIGSSGINQGLLLSLGAHCFAAASALRHFTNFSQNNFYSELQTGKKIAAFAGTEKLAGSDIMSLQCTYEKTETGYILNGEKIFITNATTADYYLIFATKNPKLYDRGLSLFLVPKNTPGFSVESFPDNALLEQSGLGNIKLNQVTIPFDYLIGKELQGAQIFHHCISIERALILIPLIGTMQEWLTTAIQHTKTRTQFHKPLSNNQFINEKIADIYKQVKLSYLLAKEITTEINNLEMIDASLIKLFISEVLPIVHQHSLSIFGANGLVGNQIDNRLLDSFASCIYSGTSEMQKLIIANALVS